VVAPLLPLKASKAMAKPMTAFSPLLMFLLLYVKATAFLLELLIILSPHSPLPYYHRIWKV
jgi:hypothetical protein